MSKASREKSRRHKAGREKLMDRDARDATRQAAQKRSQWLASYGSINWKRFPK